MPNPRPQSPPARIDQPTLDRAIAEATKALLASQRGDGHWVFELEADATIPAEYVLLKHYLDEPLAPALEQKFAVYLRRRQGSHGGWPLFHDGDFDMSASVKAYFALKMIGDPPDAPHMARAREAILARGGAKQSNVFTRVLLSLYGVLTWNSVPVMPVEIMLLPRWFPFHLTKISYWGRTVIVPLLVLRALKPLAKNRRGVTIDELFLRRPAPHRAAGKSTASKCRMVRVFPRRRQWTARRRTLVSAVVPPARDCPRGRFRHRAAQRRRWPGGDLPRHGQ